VAITMYSPGQKVGAIFHAMLPRNPQKDENLLYVDTAASRLYRKMIDCDGEADLVVKIFGGAQVLVCADLGRRKKTVGGQNLIQAWKTLEDLGLTVANADIGGTLGRKLFFSTKTGDVYSCKLSARKDRCCQGVAV
jgi:chemotaxis protein CheD